MKTKDKYEPTACAPSTFFEAHVCLSVLVSFIDLERRRQSSYDVARLPIYHASCIVLRASCITYQVSGIRHHIRHHKSCIMHSVVRLNYRNSWLIGKEYKQERLQGRSSDYPSSAPAIGPADHKTKFHTGQVDPGEIFWNNEKCSGFGHKNWRGRRGDFDD